MSDSFVHLHLHTEYSTLDGANRINDVLKRAKKYGMPAIAMTDHGVLYGAIDFFQQAKKVGIKPIIGCEVYMAPGLHTDRKATSGRDAAYHLTLLAADNTGYQNLVKLVSLAHLDGMYYKPRIDKELLATYRSGLIGLSGCLKGEVNNAIIQDQPARAVELAAQYRDILGAENFFLEMQDHGIEAQIKCNKALPAMAKDLGLGLVASNDVHFLERGSHEAHDVLVCIGTGANVTDEKRMRYVPELYLKSPAEMAELFGDRPESLTNTLAIAERCNVDIKFGEPKYPNFTPPPGLTQNQYLRQICEEGVRKRYGERAHEDPVIAERLERELGLLEKQGFVNYFLITWDFIAWAKEHGIPVGPGRGSAAGSMVAYVMGITDIDPIRFKLLFERFLNPERVSPPDIDVDFCQARRGEVIEYVRQKYGERAVSQIITFGTLGSKSVVRDVARVLGWSYADADRIAKMIPSGPGNLDITLNGEDKLNKETGQMEHIPGAVDKNPELKRALENEPATKALWDTAVQLEGLTRGTGVHAAGIVISDRDLSEYIPLTRGNDGGIVSQYAMQPLTDLGMLKMDFLGLKTLTVIHDAVELIHRKVPDFDIATITLEDQPTFDLLNRGETIAVFQLESGGMVGVCKQFDIHDIEDINAILALYRPGPMDLIPDYIKRKKGLTKVKYPHKLLEKVTADTYGIFVYQEQVMAAASALAGYTLGGADLLRRAMGKKDKEKMAVEREKFVKGCKELNDIDAKKANEIFDLLEKFAGYGFNRSHSAAYAWVSYQTAYLKANYPVEFMAAVMSNEVANTDKISIFVAECERMGIPILPPDVNRSSLKFAPEKAGELEGIRFGLAAIKNVGEGERPVHLHGEFRQPGGHEKGEPQRARIAREMRRVRLDRRGARPALFPGGADARRRRQRAARPRRRPGRTVRRLRSRRPGARLPPRHRDGDALDRRGKARVRKGAARFLRHRSPTRRLPPSARERQVRPHWLSRRAGGQKHRHRCGRADRRGQEIHQEGGQTVRRGDAGRSHRQPRNHDLERGVHQSRAAARAGPRGHDQWPAGLARGRPPHHRQRGEAPEKTGAARKPSRPEARPHPGDRDGPARHPRHHPGGAGPPENRAPHPRHWRHPTPRHPQR
jgi:DNA polymerase-3 subunit alpha